MGVAVTIGVDEGRCHFSYYFDEKIHYNLNGRMRGETHEKFESISRSSRENRLHPTVAVRRSDSYLDCDISIAWMHVIGAKPLKVKKLAHDYTIRSEFFQ